MVNSKCKECIYRDQIITGDSIDQQFYCSLDGEIIATRSNTYKDNELIINDIDYKFIGCGDFTNKEV